MKISSIIISQIDGILYQLPSAFPAITAIMPSQQKNWILVKGCEYQPGGSLSLGQILPKPFEPSNPLFPDGPLSTPDNVEPSCQASVDVGSHSSLGASFRLWADVVILPISGKVGGHLMKSHDLTWHFERLEGKIMAPRRSYVVAAMETDEAAAYIRRTHFRKRVYMITGVRTAHGARMAQKNSVSGGGNAGIDANLSELGGVGTVGFAIGGSHSESNHHSVEEASDFVYAYRLNEIHYRKDTRKTYTEAYNDGDIFGLDEQEDEHKSEALEEDPTDDESCSIDVQGIAEEYFSGGRTGCKTFSLGEGDDEEDECQFILADV